MSKIIIDARIINSTTGRYVERLLHYLQKIDRENRYVVLIPPEDIRSNFWRPTAKNFHLESCEIKNYSLAEQTRFLKLLNNHQADLVHFCMPQQPILYKGKTVTTFHDLTLIKTYNEDKNYLYFKSKQQVGKTVFKRAARKSTQIITPTEFTKNELINFAKIDPEKITVTYESADITKSEAKNPNFKFKNFLLYVGKHSTYKNVRRLAAAHQNLLKNHPDLHLVLANTKDKAVLQNEKFFASKNYKNIHFFGRADNADLAWLYSNCRAYIFPSFMEGFGLPGLEAMALGAPVISSNATCLPEVYGDAALYFDPHNTDDMTEKIHQVLTNKTLRTSLIKKGKQQHAKYSWEKMAKETYEVYQKALK
ncbi:glycosyltransferase family 4 protein [Candidatus Saccharibacteria bacterium]|nr:glycosyltransferase family 4 protein [Candidatus Saccharibacteria bacterium]